MDLEQHEANFKVLCKSVQRYKTVIRICRKFYVCESLVSGICAGLVVTSLFDKVELLFAVLFHHEHIVYKIIRNCYTYIALILCILNRDSSHEVRRSQQNFVVTLVK
jgi:hypothetical protein